MVRMAPCASGAIEVGLHNVCGTVRVRVCVHSGSHCQEIVSTALHLPNLPAMAPSIFVSDRAVASRFTHGFGN